MIIIVMSLNMSVIIIVFVMKHVFVSNGKKVNKVLMCLITNSSINCVLHICSC